MNKVIAIFFLNKWKTLVFPTICIFLYVIFTITDLFTTYLSTPDLKNETNPIYQYFQWGWIGHSFYIFFIIAITIACAIVSNNYVYNFFINKKQNKKILFAICFLLLVYCYHNLIATFECSISNYLGYRYTYIKSENIIQIIAVNYVKFYLNFNENFGENAYVYFITILESIIAVLITVSQTVRVKKYVQSTFPSRNN